MKTRRKFELQNQLGVSTVPTRSYFPAYPAFLSRLLAIKEGINKKVLTDEQSICNELIAVMQMADKLGVYYDYCEQPSLGGAEGFFGARVGTHGIGGGKNYFSCNHAAHFASTDDELHDALSLLKEGQVLLVTKDSCLELSDYLLAGETTGYNKKKLPYQWKVEDGRILCGERGVDAQGGAILKFDSFTDCCILVGKNARLSGLVIQGPDRPNARQNANENFSVGLVVMGDGAIIENCEISAFYRAGIRVVDSKNVSIRNCYFHDFSAPASGYAVEILNSEVVMSENLFSCGTSAAFVSSDSVLHFSDNMDAGNLDGSYFVGEGRVMVDHNTFLSPVDLYDESIAFFAENNFLAYSFTSYGNLVTNDNFTNNLFDASSPVLYCGKTLISSDFQPYPFKKRANVSLVSNRDITLPVLSACYYNDSDDAGYLLLKKWIDTRFAEGDAFIKLLNEAISAIGGYANYLAFCDKGLVSFVVHGQRYGAYSDTDPIGGGYGYNRIVTMGDYIVHNEDELRNALAVAKSGEVVFIPNGTYINVSSAPEKKARLVTVPAGVTLASDRGRVLEDGTVSTGAVLASSAMYPDYVMNIGGENVRITGLVIQGPDPARHSNHHARSFKDPNNQTMYQYYWEMTNTHGIRCEFSNVEFDNIELCGFNTNGMVISNKENPPKGIRVHHSYIHHCQIKGLGYGVRFNFGFAEVTHNVFNYNRHSISGGGHDTSGYVAENNVEMGESLNHYYDMHGGADRGDGTSVAGQYVYMRYNSFLGPHVPFVTRGRTLEGQDFSFNVVYDTNENSGPRLECCDGKKLDNAHVGKNAWEISRGDIEIIDGVRY